MDCYLEMHYTITLQEEQGSQYRPSSPSGKRLEFSRKTKAEAFARAKGKCEDCGVKIRPGNGPHYDHRIPDAVDGGNELSNCQVLCKPCHATKTDDDDKPEIARTKRIRDKHTKAFTKSPRGFKGWRKFNGDVVWKT